MQGVPGLSFGHLGKCDAFAEVDQELLSGQGN